MSAQAPRTGLPRAPRRVRAALIAVAALAAAALAVVAAFAPRVAAAGWLIAFVLIATVPIGSLQALMIHRLTGGRWGERLGPIWQNAAVAIPLLAVVIVPVLVALPALYAWVGGAGAVKPDVTRLYLNWPLYIARSGIAIAGWSALALLLPRLTGRAGVLLAAAGLVFHAVMITLVSLDWILSAEPVFMSTSFGATLAFLQLMAALDFAALAAPRDLDEDSVGDLAGLMLAVALGLTYINFMAVLVIWYGDLPHKAEFFVGRIAPPWNWLALLAFAFASVAPVLALLLRKVRLNLAALRAVAASSLTGIALYVAWLVAPVYGAWTLVTALVALLCLACAFAALMGANRPQFLFRRAGAGSPAHE